MSGRKIGSGYRGEKFAYNIAGNVEFLGYNSEPGASENDDGWEMTRILYDAFDRVIDRRGPLLGRWTDRELLEW